MNRLPIFLVGIAGLTTVVVGDQGASPTSPPKVATAGIARAEHGQFSIRRLSKAGGSEQPSVHEGGVSSVVQSG